ncbi:MAG: AAA family ATPase [Candidatus Dojkabacteria bacterium]
MKILKGKEKIGRFKQIPLSANWDYLYKEHGLRKEEEQFEVVVGRFLLLVGVFAMLGVFVVDIVGGRLLFVELLNTDRLPEVVFWIGFILMLYSFYLTRNRENFIDSLRLKDLNHLKRDIEDGHLPGSIELTDYFDHDLLNIIDDLLNEDVDRFMELLIKKVLRYPKVAKAVTRIGLSAEQLMGITVKFGAEKNAYLDTWIRKILVKTFQEAYRLDQNRVDELSMLLYILREPLAEYLLDREIGPKDIEALELWIKNRSDKERYIGLFKSRSALKPTNTVNRAFTSRYSPTLVEFSRDFTAEVARGDFTLSIARDVELADLIASVESSEASASLVIGAPGVGKTTLLKSLAVRMVVEDVPKLLQDMRLVGFDFNKAYALAANVDEFKTRVEQVLEETAAAKNIILVLDDFDQVVSLRKDVAGEVINLFINAIDRYKLRVIATSNLSGYARKIKPERSLVSLFHVIELKEPADEVSVQIVMDSLPRLEERYKVNVSFDAIVRLVKLSHNFAFERVLPDKAIDMLDEIMVEAQTEGREFVSEQNIEEYVSKRVGVKVGAIDDEESETLLNMEEELHKRLIGQDQAVSAVASALRRSRAGLVSGKRPIASFLFFGPTGVGKTELAKALTAVYYGDEKLMIRVDMSEYQEEENLKRLIGEEGDKGFEGGYLTEAIRAKPYSLILLDEIEKANPKVLDLFLQILDEGSVQDGMGRKVDFTNAIIIATSNAASKQIADMLSRGTEYTEVLKAVTPRLREFLRVEFLNRFDKVVMFKPLVPIEVEQVAGLMMEAQKKRLDEKGIKLTYTKKVLEQLADIGYSPVYGARELRRVMQEKIEDPIAKLIVGKRLKSGGGVRVVSLDKFSVVK